MKYEWDPAKDRANRARHGVGFEAVSNFEWARAIETEDDRFEYGEIRMLAFGPIGNRLFTLIYTARGDVVRVISLRPATPRERRDYEEATAKDH